jgi:hypothetical protein
MMNRPDDAIIYYTVTVFALMECDEEDFYEHFQHF